jgi:hypothetical protein
MHLHRIVYTFLFACCVLALTMTLALAQNDGGYDLSWWTVDGGGGTLVGSGAFGHYTLMGTSGQPDAAALDGGGYTLEGGFWTRAAVAEIEHTIYLPVVLRGHP